MEPPLKDLWSADTVFVRRRVSLERMVASVTYILQSTVIDRRSPATLGNKMAVRWRSESTV